jgi:Tol biopolymer transport system component
MREETGRSVPPLERKQTMNAASEKTRWIARPTARYLGLAVVLAALVLAFAAVPAAAQADKIIFASDRASGRGVNNPEGDFEIFSMNPDGKGRKQLTKNAADDFEPALSPDGQKIAFTSQNVQPSNPEGDPEVYQMDVGGSEPQNLTNNAVGINDFAPHYAPDGEKIAFTSHGAQTSNPEGDFEVYVMAADGSEPQNLSNTGGGLSDFASDYAPDGEEIVYSSFGVQDSNPEGDFEVYVMNALDGSADQNLTDTAGAVSDFDAAISPDGQKIAFVSVGVQPSNPEGDDEIYKMDADGSDQRNLTNNAEGVQDDFPDYSPGGKRIVYDSDGRRTSNPEGDDEIYKMNANGSDRENLTDNSGINDVTPDFGKVAKG